MDHALLDLRATIEQVLSLKSAAGNLAANELLLHAIGLGFGDDHDEAYWQEALDYHLGLTFAHLGDQAVQRRRRHHVTTVLPTRVGAV